MASHLLPEKDTHCTDLCWYIIFVFSFQVIAYSHSPNYFKHHLPLSSFSTGNLSFKFVEQTNAQLSATRIRSYLLSYFLKGVTFYNNHNLFSPPSSGIFLCWLTIFFGPIFSSTPFLGSFHWLLAYTLFFLLTNIHPSCPPEISPSIFFPSTNILNLTELLPCPIYDKTLLNLASLQNLLSNSSETAVSFAKTNIKYSCITNWKTFNSTDYLSSWKLYSPDSFLSVWPLIFFPRLHHLFNGTILSDFFLCPLPFPPSALSYLICQIFTIRNKPPYTHLILFPSSKKPHFWLTSKK